jgi:hypothetical protein
LTAVFSLIFTNGWHRSKEAGQRQLVEGRKIYNWQEDLKCQANEADRKDGYERYRAKENAERRRVDGSLLLDPEDAIVLPTADKAEHLPTKVTRMPFYVEEGIHIYQRGQWVTEEEFYTAFPEIGWDFFNRIKNKAKYKYEEPGIVIFSEINRLNCRAEKTSQIFHAWKNLDRFKMIPLGDGVIGNWHCVDQKCNIWEAGEGLDVVAKVDASGKVLNCKMLDPFETAEEKRGRFADEAVALRDKTIAEFTVKEMSGVIAICSNCGCKITTKDIRAADNISQRNSITAAKCPRCKFHIKIRS